MILFTLLAVAPAARGQAPTGVAVEFRSDASTVHGRFFQTAASEPIATVVLLPGWGAGPADVLVATCAGRSHVAFSPEVGH